MTTLLIISLCSLRSLRLTGTVFSQLLEKVIFMTLWTKAITCDKAGFKSRFCQEHQAGKNIISVNPVILSNFSSCSSCASWLKNLFNQRNLRSIKDLRSTKDYVRNYKLFMQNKPNFRKSQMNVTDLLRMDYEKKDTWSGGKNKPNSKPIQSQFKPNSNPIQTQYKPKQSQFCLIYCTFIRPFFAVKWAVDKNILLRKENYERK